MSEGRYDKERVPLYPFGVAGMWITCAAFVAGWVAVAFAAVRWFWR